MSTPRDTRMSALLRAADAVLLPKPELSGAGGAENEGELGPTVPTHVAGYLKRLLRAFKSGVPARRLIMEMDQMVEDVTPDVVRWFERLCASRLVSPATETADGYSRQRVSLSAAEIDRMLPMSCPPNGGATTTGFKPARAA